MDLLTWIGAITACLCVARYLGVVLVDTATELRRAGQRWTGAAPPPPAEDEYLDGGPHHV